MDTFLRNSSYIFLFLKVLPWRQISISAIKEIGKKNDRNEFIKNTSDTNTNRTCPDHKYSPVTVSVDAPQLHVGLGSNGGGPRGTVDQGQLSKTSSLPNTGHPFIVYIHLSQEVQKNEEKKKKNPTDKTTSLSDVDRSPDSKRKCKFNMYRGNRK